MSYEIMSSTSERVKVRGRYAEVQRSMKRRWCFDKLGWNSHAPNKVFMNSFPYEQAKE